MILLSICKCIYRVSSTTTIISILRWTIYKLLFRKWDQGPSLELIYCFNGSSRGESPAWTALTLILNWSNCTGSPPIKCCSRNIWWRTRWWTWWRSRRGRLRWWWTWRRTRIWNHDWSKWNSNLIIGRTCWSITFEIIELLYSIICKWINSLCITFCNRIMILHVPIYLSKQGKSFLIFSCTSIMLIIFCYKTIESQFYFANLNLKETRSWVYPWR